MASNSPSQTRAVDPFASYDSSSVNRLSRAVTRGNDGLYATPDLDVILDSTTPLTTVVVTTGIAFKDDVIVEITANHQVDFTNLTHYVNNSGATLNETGYYYIVLDYAWQKAKPAPTAKLKIIRPSERSNYISGLYPAAFFLKAIKIENVGGFNVITRFFDYDPSNVSVEREYVNLRINTEISLPSHSPSRDEGRIVYERSVDKFWFGFEDRWEEISAGVSLSINTDATSIEVGMLAYTDSNNNAQPALSESLNTRAEFVVLEKGTIASGNGRGRLAGSIADVIVETGIIISTGDVLYLSETEQGTVTNVRPTGTYQVIGRSLSSGNSVTPVNVIFFPGDMIFTAIAGSIDTGDWTYDSTSTFYYYDVDISVLNLASNAALADTWIDGFRIMPADVEIRSAGTIMRIYMSVNTEVVDYIISDGAGGGSATGAGGTTSHALLTNLDYATAGHTGFAPSPHGNANHSAAFITAASVTYGNLNANGDVGTGAGQVSIGDHTHADIMASGNIILFESDVAVTGYTLLTTLSDQMVYITPGSATDPLNAGGATKFGSTWTQPSHAHTTGDHALTIAELASHTHVQNINGSDSDTHPAGGPRASGSQFTISTVNGPSTDPTGGGGSHNHGTTAAGTPVNTWRPQGINYTRQQKT